MFAIRNMAILPLITTSKMQRRSTLKLPPPAEAKPFITRAVLCAEPRAKKPLKQVNMITQIMSAKLILKIRRKPPAMKRATPETFIAAPAIVKSERESLSPKMPTIRLPFGQLTKRITGRCARQSAAETSLTKRRTAAVRQPA